VDAISKILVPTPILSNGLIYHTGRPAEKNSWAIKGFVVKQPTWWLTFETDIIVGVNSRYIDGFKVESGMKLQPVSLEFRNFKALLF
jgi:hypothetical protein